MQTAAFSGEQTERDPLDDLVRQVQGSAKYRTVHPSVIRRIGARELAARGRLREAIKATRAKLHQVGGAYFARSPNYARWLQTLARAAATGRQEDVRKACREILAGHSSTKERLPILERFFADVLSELAPVASVLDLACGLTPLAIPWMPLAPGAAYYALDMYTDLVAFLAEAMKLLGLRGEATAGDVLDASGLRQADVAFLLKAIPCLEQLDREATARLLDQVPTRWVIVSFPVRSLGGREKGMRAQYEERFRALLQGKSWAAERYAFESELAFVVDKGAPLSTVGEP